MLFVLLNAGRDASHLAAYSTPEGQRQQPEQGQQRRPLQQQQGPGQQQQALQQQRSGGSSSGGGSRPWQLLKKVKAKVGLWHELSTCALLVCVAVRMCAALMQAASAASMLLLHHPPAHCCCCSCIIRLQDQPASAMDISRGGEWIAAGFADGALRVRHALHCIGRTFTRQQRQQAAARRRREQDRGLAHKAFLYSISV